MPDGRLRRSNAWTLDGSETSAAPVSPDACIRLRSNAGGTAIEVSYDQAAYVTLSSSGGSDGTGTELQRTNGSGGFVKVTGSSVSGGIITLADTLIVRKDASAAIQVEAYVGSTSGSALLLAKARGTRASPTKALSGDTLGLVTFYGQYDTTADHLVFGASVRADAQQDFNSTTDRGADLIFSTTYTGGLGIHSGMRIQHNQYVLIAKDSAAGDAGGQLHVKATTDSDIGFIVNTASSTATADIARFQHNGTTKVKWAAISGGAVNSVFGSAALATNATDGFVYLPTCAGTPTGAATAYTGTSAFVLDTTNSKVYFYYSSAWHDLTGTGGANTALSNLASVSINASLIPQTTLDLGANTTAWRNLYIYGAGTYGSHSFKLHGTPTGHRVLTLPDVTDIVAVLGTSQTFTAPALIFGGTLAQTTANTATSSTQSFFDQNITIAPGGSSSAAYRMFDLSVLFTTAQTLSGSVILYNSSVTHSQNSSLASYYVHFDTFTKDTANSASAVTGYDWVVSISSGTTSDLFGYIADFTVGASGTATTTIGFTSTLVNAGTATTYYAYRAIKSGTIANPYGFGSSAGFLHGFGTLTPTVVMDIVGGAADEVVKVTGDSINTAITGYAFGTGKAPIFKLVHGRNTAASPQTTESGDTLGSFVFYGQYDSTVGHIAGVATISAIAQAQFTASNAAPADLAFFTRPSSGSGNHQALLLTSDQRVGVGYDMAHSDVGARLHVLETDTAVVAAIVRTAASSTADCLRLMASSTVKVKFTTNSSGDMNSVFGSAALATNATDGFIFAPTCAGAATGTPSTYTGTAPVVVDTTNFRIYVNIPGTGWKMAQLI